MAFDVFGKSTTANNVDFGNKVVTFNGIKDDVNYHSLYGLNDRSKLYSSFNRYDYINPTENLGPVKEILFFTKPNLNIFRGSDYNNITLNPSLQQYPIFIDAYDRHKASLSQLQYDVNDPDNIKSPFMWLLGNMVSSNLDVPEISAEVKESTTNLFGFNIQYRDHSLRSDNGYDFSLSFNDNDRLDVYYVFKMYDEYIRLCKLGYVSPKREHIINSILWDNFSIYKFIISLSDGESIVWYAKATGVTMNSVPRDSFSEVNDKLQYSISFHAQDIQDNDPSILSDFNLVSNFKNADPVPVYSNGRVNTTWVKFPYIEKISSDKDARVRRKLGFKYDYRLKWENRNK